MSNDEFIKYIPIIHGAIKRYRNCNIEYDDLYQIGSMAVVKMYDKYDPTRGMTLNNFLFKCVIWAVNRELEKNKAVDNFINISTNTPINDDNSITVEDTLQDIKVNIEEQITDKLILQDYYDEIMRCLSPKKSSVMILKVFYNMSYKDISKTLTIPESSICNILMNGRMDLLRKSPLIKEAYLNYVEAQIDYYNPVENAALQLDYYKRVKENYK